MSEPGTRAWLASPPGRGGIAIIELEGSPDSIEKVIRKIAPGSRVDPG